ncbi:tRNA1(Val) (adenine(37)-N6)-methyltransferase [Caulobacter sp. 17J80-11]|uniref:tRNA1(Val) (adenine(37)-N6)-methyltransferase n=1 Tax=Caulobacter sp. 17J80-11 TaxID=2763502 RepID=UPI001653BE81|nr:methyltransferase [Caulobacter sp. 17J80-11]MBC6981068.1 methyltransferase [Caulobacter sp. 17J80-11]
MTEHLDAPPLEQPLVTDDRLLDGRVRLLQPAKGYRAGMDAALLAAAVDAKPGERVLEAGCGAGAVLFQAASRSPEARFTGVERDLEALALAERNIGLNDAEGRVQVRAGDVGRGFAAHGFLAPGEPPFDVAIANPPFFDDPNALRAPHPSRRAAWIADTGLDAWTRFLLKAVREGGRIVVIHRADRLADLLALLGATAGSFQIRAIHPFADAPAKRVLVQAVKTGKAPLRILPPLVLHARGDARKHTPEAEAVLRGEAGLGWM